MLWLMMQLQHKAPLRHGSRRCALALLIYTAALSFAYRSLNTGAGAQMLSGALIFALGLCVVVSAVTTTARHDGPDHRAECAATRGTGRHCATR